MVLVVRDDATFVEPCFFCTMVVQGSIHKGGQAVACVVELLKLK